MQTQKLSLLSIIVLMSYAGAMQAYSSPVVPPSAKASLAASVSAKTVMAETSGPLLSSPLLSPAEKAQLQNEQWLEDEAYALVKLGDEAAKVSDWTVAEKNYQEALEVSPAYGLGYQLSLYGMIACCRATGDTTQGLAYSRLAVYRHGSAAKGFHENDAEKLMQFALLLNKTGQVAEAMSVYNHAAHLLDYEDSDINGGQPTLKVLFPEVVMGDARPDQVQYTPERLQAFADALLTYQQQGFRSYKEIKAYAQEAATLYPASAAVQYYLGEALSGSYYAVLDSPAKDKAAAQAAYQADKKARAAAYQKAAELGDERTAVAAKERLAVLR